MATATAAAEQKPVEKKIAPKSKPLPAPNSDFYEMC